MPAAFKMAERLADEGYLALLPDLFYRYGRYGPFDSKVVLQGDVKAILGPLVATTSNLKAAQDTAAFLAYLDTRSGVVGNQVGAVVFCLGGGMTIAAAGTYPNRFAAFASYHGGNLATDGRTIHSGSRDRRQLSSGDGPAVRDGAEGSWRAL